MSWAISTKSHSSGRVSLGSIMSIPWPLPSPPVASAVRKGEAMEFSRSSISCLFCSGLSDDAISLL